MREVTTRADPLSGCRVEGYMTISPKIVVNIMTWLYHVVLPMSMNTQWS
jgi:hypothetical protein